VKANADALKEQLAAEGYKTLVVENVEAPAGAARYRVIVGTFDDRASAAAARDAFKAKYPNRSDFQGAWLLYRIK
jgi:cell division protein FtsN